MTAMQGAEVSRWLALAATPTFAIMGLLTGWYGGPRLCAMGTPLGGMVPMYLLMSAFHAQPWLRLLSGSRGAASCAAADGRVVARP